MDPITTAILSWLTGEVGTASVRIIGKLARGDRQQIALEAIVTRSVDTAVDALVADRERGDVREVLLRDFRQDTDAVGPGDILGLEAAVSRALGPRLELLQEQGFRLDPVRFTNTLAGLIREGIEADADRGGPLVPLAEHMRHERVATASEATAAASRAMADELQAIRRSLAPEAKDRTIHATGRGRLGRPIADLPSPLTLGVHQAVRAGDIPLPVLPEYIPRGHDRQLQLLIDGADLASKMIVLVGDSSTGKTRALWEALRRLPGRWRVWSPAGARALDEGLAAAGVGPQTVVWLDDAHNYLGPASQLAEDITERLVELIAAPDGGPVLIAATLWPEYWQQLTAQPRRRGQAGFTGAEGSLVPALLESATYIEVPSAFASQDLDVAVDAAGRDPRLALALEHASGGKITQYLAGAPKLLERYRSAPPEAKALIDAAVDARRFGHANRLPERLLLNAVSGYIDTDSWDRLCDGWATQSLEALAQDWRGLPGPLTRIRPRLSTGPDGGPEYRLADFLEQIGGRDRRYVAPPKEFWEAAAHNAHYEDLAAIGNAAQTRGRLRDASRIYLKAAAADDAWALNELALMREQAGDHAGAEQTATKAAFAGDCHALKVLAMYRQQAKDHLAEERLYRIAVEAGDKECLPFLPTMREKAGDHTAAERLALEAARGGDYEGLTRIISMRAKAGNYPDAERLAFEALDMGDPAPMTEVAAYWASDGNSAEAERLYRLAAERGDDYALIQLVTMLEDHGDHDGAGGLALEAAQNGIPSVLTALACKRLGVDGIFNDEPFYRHAAQRLSFPHYSDTRRMVQQAADMGDGRALGILAQAKANTADYDQASQLAIRAAEAGSSWPLRELAQKCADAGERAQAEQLAQKAAAAGDADALNIVARMREADGNHDEADRLAIQAALADEHWALDDIVEQREQAGDHEGAERLALNAAKTTHVEHYDDFSITQRPLSALWELSRMRLSRHDHTGVEELAVKAAADGYTDELTRLADHRRREEAYDDARRLYELASDFGDADALANLAAMLQQTGNFVDAMRFYERAINGGSKSALRGLASLWDDIGDHESASRGLRYGLDAKGDAASAWTFSDTDEQASASAIPCASSRRWPQLPGSPTSSTTPDAAAVGRTLTFPRIPAMAFGCELTVH